MKITISAMNIFAAKTVRQAAQSNRAYQNAEQAGGPHHAVLGRGDIEFLRDQRHRDTGHEDDETLEELTCSRKAPDAPLHGGHQRGRQRGTVRPHRRLVDIVLNRLTAYRRWLFGHCRFSHVLPGRQGPG